MIANSPNDALLASESGEPFVIYNGDCFELLAAAPDGLARLILSSPPYFMGKIYDRSYRLQDFIEDHQRLAPLLERVVADGGNICWQTGYHVLENTVFPLDYAVYQAFTSLEKLALRNRIIWQFGHGVHARRRFSGRHETVLWFSKGGEYHFDLDSVRVEQKYPGKRHYKGPHKGAYSGNPLGKNPEDVWDIPNVKANHVEKTDHPCQFPIALCQRLIKALCPEGGLVLDPFAGSGSAGIAALVEGRRFIGCDTSLEFCQIAEQRYQKLQDGALRIRPLERAVWQPSGTEAVARKPAHFA